MDDSEVAKNVVRLEPKEGRDIIESREERTSRLKDYISKLEKNLADIFRLEKENQNYSFCEEEIRSYLTKTPGLIAQAQLELAKCQRAYSYAKSDTATIKASLWNFCCQNKERLGLTNAKDREAWVLVRAEYIEAQRQEMEWKFIVDSMEAVYERYDNLFVSARKLANLIEKEQENVYREEKYGI